MAREVADETVLRLIHDQLEGHRQALRETLSNELSAIKDSIYEQRYQTAVQQSKRWRVAAALTPIIALSLAFVLANFLGNRDHHTLDVHLAASTDIDQTDVGERGALIQRLIALRLEADQERQSLLNALEWSLNQHSHFEYGRIPFDDSRLSLLNELAYHLQQSGFGGVVRLDAHVGDFCLVRGDNGELQLAPDRLPVGECDSIGFDPATARRLGEQQSLAFANFTRSSPLFTEGNIRLEIRSHGRAYPRVDYPSTDSDIRAAEWNAIAQRNQRVEISLLPHSTATDAFANRPLRNIE
ncbi:hypothetical protein [Alkalilimnicola ehrlichii]|uniref:Uncharacterized protein n=1 Tax=Alkalilimnicola ehrlichii TaxID=351052 RepID=A0A3E0WJZ7_9GAMM|nr:hypothetical protein [Alkalilimnicola ehrlichii]RFA32533.1 hypothetical protein CAL65_19410 [Alkalilimnicola ehrlichii]